MEKLIKNVEQWAKEKGIDDYKNWGKQFMKFQEEAIELHTEMVLRDICTSDKEDMKLEMGDVLVTLIGLDDLSELEVVDRIDGYRLSKSEWEELGINDTNADFEEVDDE